MVACTGNVVQPIVKRKPYDYNRRKRDLHTGDKSPDQGVRKWTKDHNCTGPNQKKQSQIVNEDLRNGEVVHVFVNPELVKWVRIMGQGQDALVDSRRLQHTP